MQGMIIDSFAGGGGASTGIERALGRPVDVAINHDAVAVAMHKANHPATAHYCKDVWEAKPYAVCGHRPVDLAWFSPDCTHHSKAKGGKPIRGPKETQSRDLAWVVVMWARTVRPRVIMLENVEEFRDWGPLLQDGRPCPDRRGFTFRKWVKDLQRLGYRVEWRELRGCDYGAPTIRKRLFMIARRDGMPIVWPAPTHGPGLLPYRTAADIIDWSQPVHSIFMDREDARDLYRRTGVRVNRPLADATMARIARGVWKYVINAADPFIVPVTHAGDMRVHPIDEPLRTVTCASRGELAVVAPTLIQTGYGEREGQAPRALDLQQPLGTVVAGGSKHALVSAFLAQHNGGPNNHGLTGRPANEPLSTVTVRGTQQTIVAAHLVNMKGSTRADQSITEPVPTICASTVHAATVQAFLCKYYGTAVGQDARDPLHSATTKARFGIVTVHGVDYQIVDIGMRMLTPRELFRAQGFPDDYIIDCEHDGKALTKTAQIKCCGNSVCPPVAEALVRANLADVQAAVA